MMIIHLQDVTCDYEIFALFLSIFGVNSFRHNPLFLTHIILTQPFCLHLQVARPIIRNQVFNMHYIIFVRCS